MRITPTRAAGPDLTGVLSEQQDSRGGGMQQAQLSTFLRSTPAKGSSEKKKKQSGEKAPAISVKQAEAAVRDAEERHDAAASALKGQLGPLRKLRERLAWRLGEQLLVAPQP